jgi:hypothetical protein
MKKLHRTALVAGMLAFGVAACGDDVTITEPTPPPPPPLSVTLTPSNAAVGVGEVADFAVGVSGGAEGATASWTCASSNTGVATVSTTDSGCRATGVASGSASITATVTKGNQSSNAGAQLTVAAAADTDAQVSIQSISHAGGSSLTGIAGQLDVRINLTPNDETVTRLELVIVENGEESVVAAQEFAAGAFAEDEAAEQTQEIVLSFNTARYDLDEEAGVGIPDFINGNKQLSARAFTVQAGDANPSAINTITVEFANEDFFDIMTEVDGSSALSATGVRWYEGDVTIMAYPVFYSGKTAGQVQLALHNLAAAPGGVLAADVIEEGPYTVTFYRDEDEDDEDKIIIDPFEGQVIASAILFAYEDGSTPTFSAGFGIEGLSLSETTRFDIQGPTLANLARALRSQRWVGIDWAFRGGNTAFGQAAADTVSLPTDGGIGATGDRVSFYAATDLEDEDTFVSVTTTADVDETDSLAEGYYLIFKATDRLGNETVLFAEYDDVNNVWIATGTDDADDASLFGVDLTRPEIEFVEAGTFDANFFTDDATVDFPFDVEVVETGPSGPAIFSQWVENRLRLWVPGSTVCIEGIGTACNFQFFDPNTLPSFFESTSQGYYQLQFRTQDLAGNISEVIDRLALFDAAAPTITVVQPGGAWTTSTQIQAILTDNIDLASARGWFGFPFGNIQLQDGAEISGFGPALVNTGNFNITTSLHHVWAFGEWRSLGTFEFEAMDHAENVTFSGATPIGGTLRDFPEPGDATDPGPVEHYDFEVLANRTEICSNISAPPETCTTPRTVRITPVLQIDDTDPGVEFGDVENIFSQVRVYWLDPADAVWKLVGQSAGASVDTTTGTVLYGGVNFTAPDDLGGATLEFRAVGTVSGAPNAGLGFLSEDVTVPVVNP